jgi:protein-S-isoprenylcysteine O-methyltransferase Ste14
MKKSADSPGVYIPPPLIYAAIFAISVLLQKWIPIGNSFNHHSTVTITAGIICLLAGLVFSAPALRQFKTTKNTLILIRPANSLQTSGIYARSRNPMYVSLLFMYCGFAFLFGNYWTFLLFPVLVIIISRGVIVPEEKYLLRAFGNAYTEYKSKVRRWI